MELIYKNIGDVVSLNFKGRLDASSAAQAEQAVQEFLGSGGRKLLIDLTGLEYISSAGLRVILIASKGIKRNSGKLALCGLAGNVRDVLDISGLAALFSVAEGEREAVALLAGD